MVPEHTGDEIEIQILNKYEKEVFFDSLILVAARVQKRSEENAPDVTNAVGFFEKRRIKNECFATKVLSARRALTMSILQAD